MDPVAHTLAGLSLAALATPASVPRRAAIATCLVASVAPDLDALMLATHGAASFAHYHNGPTHWAGLLLAPVVLAWPAARLAKTAWRPLALLALAAVALHMLLDALGPWGLQPLAPLVPGRVRLGLVGELDLGLWLVLAAPLALFRLARLRRAAVAGAALAVYVGLGGLSAWLGASAAWEVAEREGLPTEAVEVAPTGLWAGGRLATLVDSSFARGLRVDLLGAADRPHVAAPRNVADPAVQAALAVRSGQVFAAWAVSPVATVVMEDPRATWLTVTLRDAVLSEIPSSWGHPSLTARVVREGDRYEVRETSWSF